MTEPILSPAFQTYGEWVRRELRRRRVSQRMLAHRAGLNHSAISRIVAGHSDPRMGTAVRIATVLGWPPIEDIDEHGRAVTSREAVA